MHVLVFGSGVIGVATAWYLRRAGVEVTVVDRQPGPAMETSFANAGQISPGYAAPWAAPGVPLKALKWLLMKDAPLHIRPRADLAQYLWLARMLGQCTSRRYAINKARMLRLARYSRDCLDALREETGLSFEDRQQGTVQLFRTRTQREAAARDVAVLDACGVPCEWLDQDGIVAVEPALANTIQQFVGALRLPLDQTGDCALFTRRLHDMAKAAGVQFRFAATLEQLHVDNGRISGASIDGERQQADAYVLALGSHSPRLLAPLGLRIPVFPLKGYSLTVPITDPKQAPASTVLDETYKVAITRFDHRIRVGGMAEVCGYDLSLPAPRRATLQRVLTRLYPGAGDPRSGTFWTGLRAATPDGTPLVGATGFDNLYLNTGHGTLGWTMACGSGQYLADLMTGKVPHIDGEGLDASRYGHRASRAARMRPMEAV